MIDSWRYKTGNYLANADDIKQHIKFYVDLIEKCETQPERMANQIHNLTKELESNRHLDIKYHELLKENLEQHGKIKELNIALEDLQRSVFSRIKDLFKEWFFGKK